MILAEYTSSASAVEAQEVENRISDLYPSDLLFEGRYESEQGLKRIRVECSEEGWDGYDAKPISTRSWNYAKAFLDRIPIGLIYPDPGINANGEVSLEWRTSNGKLLSMTFDDFGDIHYIVFLGSERFYSRVPFFAVWKSRRFISFLDEVLT